MVEKEKHYFLKNALHEIKIILVIYLSVII